MRTIHLSAFKVLPIVTPNHRMKPKKGDGKCNLLPARVYQSGNEANPLTKLLAQTLE